ncbi:hypothetical protein BKX93_02085 [Chromobacterium vaccinii]|uniref:Uncharacterized protein n=2 Tax=Chromobacterium vaccinii TaxID=1108595 RepID=A0A1D9LCA7_9NEIS|nr:hypothetical protein BKX93_02085 [Chromobacterium vaccinii]
MTMTTLYTQALQHHTNSYRAVLSALERQHHWFDRVDDVAADINRETPLQALASYHPTCGLFIRLGRPIQDTAQLGGVCQRHRLALVRQSAGRWLLAPTDGKDENLPAIQLILD